MLFYDNQKFHKQYKLLRLYSINDNHSKPPKNRTFKRYRIHFIFSQYFLAFSPYVFSFSQFLLQFSSTGEVVYNRTDRAGCNYYALCSKECEIEPYYGPCPVTTPVPSVASSTTSQAASPTTATTLTTSVERNCTDVSPARKVVPVPTF